MADNHRCKNEGNPVEVFYAFLKLGVTSFGGPVAHLGYFRKEFVERRKWITDTQFAQLLTICQFLPGPASSQLGFCIGLLRAGWSGALLAFLGFTLPSVALLILFAQNLSTLPESVNGAVVHGLKLVACVVVADAVLAMVKKFCPDVTRKVIAALAFVAVVAIASPFIPLLVIVVAALAGWLCVHHIVSAENSVVLPIRYGVGVGGSMLALFMLLLVGLPLVATKNLDVFSIAAEFYWAGALVFGGGHVVLPLLEEAVVNSGGLTVDQFLAGYGASQAIPGPMFAFSAYLGFVIAQGENVWLLSSVALIFIFLPGFLLVAGLLPFWQSASKNYGTGRAIAGVNAAVVGVLAATLYSPVMVMGVTDIIDMVTVIVGLGCLVVFRLSPLMVVLWCVVVSMLRVIFW